MHPAGWFSPLIMNQAYEASSADKKLPEDVAVSSRWATPRSGDGSGELIAQDAPEGPEAVAPADFFPFGVAAAGVADGAFVEADGREAGELAGELDFDPEAPLAEAGGDAGEELAAEHFVAGFHVRQVEAGFPVREPGDHLVGELMPVGADRAFDVAETAAEDDVGLILEDGLEEGAEILRVVFHVGVLHHDDVAGAVVKTGLESCPFSLIPFVEDDHQVLV